MDPIGKVTLSTAADSIGELGLLAALRINIPPNIGFDVHLLAGHVHGFMIMISHHTRSVFFRHVAKHATFLMMF